MLGPKTDSDHSGGKTPKTREFFKKLQNERGRKRFRGFENARQKMFVHEDLKFLRQPGGFFPAQLDRTQVGVLEFPGAKFFREQVGRGHRVLDGQVDSNASNGRHRMR